MQFLIKYLYDFFRYYHCHSCRCSFFYIFSDKSDDKVIAITMEIDSSVTIIFDFVIVFTMLSLLSLFLSSLIETSFTIVVAIAFDIKKDIVFAFSEPYYVGHHFCIAVEVL